MNPKEFRDWYTNLTVNTINTSGGSVYFTGLHVDTYAMNKPAAQTAGQLAIDAIRQTAAAKNKSFQTSARDSLGWAVQLDNAAFNYAKLFRGTPAQLEHILSVGIQCGYFRSPTQQSLQKFIDDSFRTDCVGFVSSYFRHTRGADFFKWDDVANHGCGPFYDKAKANGYFNWYPSEIWQGDVILWMLENRKETRTPGHISLVQSVVGPSTPGGPYELTCVESNGATGKDPRETKRIIKAATGGQDEEGDYIYWKGPDGSSYLELGDGSKVIVITLY